MYNLQICVTTIKPEVQVTRKCLAQVRSRVAVADLAFSSSKWTVHFDFLWRQLCRQIDHCYSFRLLFLFGCCYYQMKVVQNYIGHPFTTFCGWLSFLGCPVLAHEFLTPRGSLSIFLYLLQNIINILLTGFLRYVQKCMQ